MDFYNSTVRDWIKHIPKEYQVYVADKAGWCYDVTDENIDRIPGIDLVPSKIEFDSDPRTVMFHVNDVNDVKEPEDV